MESVIISQSQKHYILASQNDLVCSSLSHNCMSLEPCADSGAADGTGPREGAGVHVGGAGQPAAQGGVRGGLGPGRRPVRGCSGAPPSGGGQRDGATEDRLAGEFSEMVACKLFLQFCSLTQYKFDGVIVSMLKFTPTEHGLEEWPEDK